MKRLRTISGRDTSAAWSSWASQRSGAAQARRGVEPLRGRDVRRVREPGQRLVAADDPALEVDDRLEVHAQPLRCRQDPPERRRPMRRSVVSGRQGQRQVLRLMAVSGGSGGSSARSSAGVRGSAIRARASPRCSAPLRAQHPNLAPASPCRLREGLERAAREVQQRRFGRGRSEEERRAVHRRTEREAPRPRRGRRARRRGGPRPARARRGRPGPPARRARRAARGSSAAPRA